MASIYVFFIKLRDNFEKIGLIRVLKVASEKNPDNQE